MITVMTYNVGNGLVKPQKLVTYLRKLNVDIIGLEELTLPQANAIDKELSAEFPYRALYGLGIPGKGILSRYPIEEAHLLTLYPARPDLLALVNLAGVPLRIIVAHPRPPYFGFGRVRFDLQTTAQIKSLSRIASDYSPTILMGDFNMTHHNPAYAVLKDAGLIDAFIVAGKGRGNTLPMCLGYLEFMRRSFGWLRLLPFIRVDYIWITSLIQVHTVWVEQGVGSDHCPVLAELSL